MKRCIFCRHAHSFHILKTDTRLNDVMWCHNVESPMYSKQVIAGKDGCDLWESGEKYYKYREDVAYAEVQKAARDMLGQDILFALNVIAYCLWHDDASSEFSGDVMSILTDRISQEVIGRVKL